MSVKAVHTTQFTDIELMKRALQMMGAQYEEDQTVSTFVRERCPIVVPSCVTGTYSVGYKFNTETGVADRITDHMADTSKAAEFEWRLMMHYNLAYVTEQLAQGGLDAQIEIVSQTEDEIVVEI